MDKMDSKTELRKKILAGERIAPEEGRALFDWDILELGYLGNERRKLAFPEERVGFIIDRIVNYTNICEAACSFCAFHARAGRTRAYQLSHDEICSKVEELVSLGGTQVMLQGGLHPEHTLDYYISLLKAVRERFPRIFLHSFSPAEMVHISRKSGVNLDIAIKALREAGLSSMPGASDLLVERIRSKVSPRKLTADQWCQVMDALHRQGLKSSATMTYGMGETLEERIEHLDTIRRVQDRTGIIRAFIPWSFSPSQTLMEDLSPASGIDYLKIVAIGRIFLDNVTYIQAGWLTEGMKLAQIALDMGANDMGGVLIEEVVVKATGIETSTNQAELIDIIRNAGKQPEKRDSDYSVLERFQ